MHRELSSILQLWQHDCSVDSIRARGSELKATVESLGTEIEQLNEAATLIGKSEKELATEQASAQRELDRYVVRRDRSKELLRGGHSLDFGTVQKQYDQCSEKVDELELKILQFMEDRESCKQNIEETVNARQQAEASRKQAHEQWVREGGELRSELEKLWPLRQHAAAELTREQQVRYEDFRKRDVSPVAIITDKTCGSCHVVVANHLRMEVSNGKRLHVCRGCGRWLLPSEAPNIVDDAGSDA